MSAAVIQGAPVVTFDTDLWIDLPARQYMRVARICLKLGAVMHANTVFIFSDDTIVNVLYAVTGLRSFSSEYPDACRLRWIGLRDVPVLTLNQIYRSKSAIRRPKDLVHMELLKQLMTCKRRIGATIRRRRRARPRDTK